MSNMEQTIHRVQAIEANSGGSKPLITCIEVHDSNEYGTKTMISSELVFGLDDENVDELQQPRPSDDFKMVLNDEESSGSHYSIYKPKAKKKKKLAVSRKEFLDLQSKVYQILAAVTSSTPQTTTDSSQQSRDDRVQARKTREFFC